LPTATQRERQLSVVTAMGLSLKITFN